MLNRIILLLVILILQGCATFNQGKNEVIVRNPQTGAYDDSESIEQYAKSQWLFAALSANVYREKILQLKIEKASKVDKYMINNVNINFQLRNLQFNKAGFEQACTDENSRFPIPKEWVSWPKEPGILTLAEDQEVKKRGLYFEIFQHNPTSESLNKNHVIAIVFEGTNFTELPDWISNFRWFLRFIPLAPDQYSDVSTIIEREFYKAILEDSTMKIDPISGQLLTINNEPITIIATGHSLGGGLAQGFSYNFFHLDSKSDFGPKVSKVFAFDTSPVTGWFSSPNPPRDFNTTDLRINRIYEEGEVLSYLRILTKFGMSKRNPEIWEYRYNFDSNINPITNHEMTKLTCGLIYAAKPW